MVNIRLVNIVCRLKSIGFLHIFSSNLLVEILAFGSQFFVAWLLTPEELGYIKVFQSFIAVYVAFSLLGFDTSLLVLGASDFKHRNRYLKSALSVLIIPIFAVILISTALAKLNLYSSTDVVNNLFICFSIIIFPQVYNRILLVDFQGGREFKLIAKLQFISKAITVLFIFLCTYCYGIYGYMLSCLLGFFLTGCLFLKHKKNIFSLFLNFSKFDFIVAKKHWTIAKFSMIDNLINIIQKYLDLFIINFVISDKAQLGYYGFALTLLIPYDILLSSLQQVLIPHFCASIDQKMKVTHLLSRCIFLYCFAGIGIVLISYVCVPFFVEILFKEKFIPSLKFFYILILYWYFYGFAKFIASALTSMKKTNYLMLNQFILFPISIILMFLSLKYLDIYGLAYSKIILAILSVILLYFFYRKTTLDYVQSK